MSSPSTLVTLSNTGIREGERWLLRDVSLSVERGEIVTLVGPNGSGKSTTAKLALGIVEPSVGKITQKPGLRVGYVPQRLALDPAIPLTVERLMRLTSRLAKGEAQAALDRTGVAHLRKQTVHGLSGGEMQRVLLARAIARKPDLLVLDEPAQGVDLAGEVALYQLIADIRHELECGILLVSHDLHLVMAETDRVICLNGHICCQGTPGDVMQDAQYRELFGDRAADSIAVYRHQHDHEHLPDGSVRHADGTISDDCGHHQSGLRHVG
ncbi:MAG: zinc ABC transporter ATP-binding protein ZnuC [Pseudomonadota bacterium]